MVRNRKAEIPVKASSGNVFADIGLPQPEEELTKAQLASLIRQVIKRRRLTQVAAAALLGLDQPKVSALLNGRLANFSSERLMRLLTALGQDVDITVRAKPRNRAHGRLRVLAVPSAVHKAQFKAHLLGGAKVDDFSIERSRDTGRNVEL
jgi:predicted XRE-type DNA-binding protein